MTQGKTESRFLRNFQAKVVSGTDAATLETALNEFFEDAGEKVHIEIFYVADYKVLILFAK